MFTDGSRTKCISLIQSSDEWAELAAPVHQRSATRILHGCLENGGLYVKLGQGLVSMNHILPKQYISTLEVLQDKVLPRGKDDASTFLHYLSVWITQTVQTWVFC